MISHRYIYQQLIKSSSYYTKNVKKQQYSKKPTMSTQPPTQTDIQILTQIIQSANHRYLHQSRIHKKSSFNILRILSAYKDLSQKYSARKQNLYNWIIYITRNYNPQRYGEWLAAVRELGQLYVRDRNKGISSSNSGYGYINNSLSASNINLYANPHNSNNISRSQSAQTHHHPTNNNNNNNNSHSNNLINRKTSTKQYSQKSIIYGIHTNPNTSSNYNSNNYNYNYSTNYNKNKQTNNQQFSNTYNLQDYQQSIYNKHLADNTYNNNNQSSQCYQYSYNHNYNNNNSNNYSSINNNNKNPHYRSRQLLNYSADQQFNLIPPVSSKLHHYISFQPDSQNKQNINSANTHNNNNNEHNKQQIMNQPTRTPGQQSFIHNLPLSYGSPFILSKITNNTKEVTEVQVQQDQEEQTVEWVNMKARADIFYGINLKFKVISALLANFQAFQTFQEVLKKTKKFRKRLCFSRFHKAATLYMNNKRSKQKIIDSATYSYQLNLLKKSFKIISIFYQLKIKTQKPIPIHKFNPTNFQFLITLIFSSTHPQQYQPMHSIHDTPRSIREKSKYFQNIEDSQKMGIISEYFSSNLKLSKEEIHGLFQMHRKARKEKVWKILKNNVRLFKKQNELLLIVRKRIAMGYLIKYHKNTLSNNVRVKMMHTSKQRTLKQKSFNALCQFLMSKKIYMKRQEFLRNSHKQLIMKNIMALWRNRKQQVQIKKMGRNACVEKGTSILVKVICSKFMKYMVEQHEELKIKQAEYVKSENRKLCKQIFQFLKERIKERKIHIAIKTAKNSKIQKQILKYWFKLTKLCLSLKKLTKKYKSQAFTTIKNETQLAQKSRKLSLHLKQQKQRNALKQLRISFNLDKTDIQTKIAKAWKTIQNEQFSIFIKITKNDIKYSAKTKKQKQLQSKQKITQQTIQRRRKSLAISQLRQNRRSIVSYTKKQQIIQSVMGNRKIKLMQDDDQSQQIGGQTYTRCHMKMKKEVFSYLRENREFGISCIKLEERVSGKSYNLMAKQLKKWQQVTKLNSLGRQISQRKAKKQFKNTLRLLKQLYETFKTKTKKSITFHEKSLKFKTLLSFAKSIIYSSNLLTTLKNKLTENTKQRQGQILVTQLSRRLDLKNKRQKVSKLLFIRQLQKSSYSSQDIEQKKQKLLRMLKKDHIKRLPFSRLLQIQHKISNEFLQQAYKKFAIMKVNQALIRHILHQKQIYMAIKFKALHLCRLSFKSLLLNKEQSHPTHLANSKKYKIHEHISTSYSSL